MGVGTMPLAVPTTVCETFCPMQVGGETRLHQRIGLRRMWALIGMGKMGQRLPSGPMDGPTKARQVQSEVEGVFFFF